MHTYRTLLDYYVQFAAGVIIKEQIRTSELRPASEIAGVS